jgi:hypothetical protein
MRVASAGNDWGSVSARREPKSFDDDPVGRREQPTEQVDTHADQHPGHLFFGSQPSKVLLGYAGCSRSLIESIRR